MGVAGFFAELFSNPPSTLHQLYVLLGGFILLFGLVSLFVKERLYLTEPLVATLVGIGMGPLGLDLVNPHEWFGDDFYSRISEAARLIMGLQIMATAVSIPREFMGKHWKSLAMMLGPVMGVMWGVSAIIVHFTLNLSWLEALIIAACITPTDPVLAHSVIKGKFAERYIPTRLRNLLAVESGANDGLGFPFMMLPIWLIIEPTVKGALTQWAIHTWIWEIFGSIVVGLACGFLARHLLKISMARKLIDKESFLVFTIALTLFVSGLVAIMASDDLFAIFVAGITFAWDEELSQAHEDSHINEVIDMIFNISFFVLFGAIIPWKAFLRFNIGKLVLCSTSILLFRRLPIVMMLRPWISALQSRKESFFAGWFGPIGVGAIFFAVQARAIFTNHHYVLADASFLDDIFTIVCFVILSSILIHGITVPLTNTHLKRRMKLKVKRRKKLAAQLNDLATAAMAVTSPSETVTEIVPPSSPLADASALSSPYPATVMEGEEYVYITDDEDNLGENDSTLMESPIGPNDIVIHDGDHSTSMAHRVSSGSLYNNHNHHGILSQLQHHQHYPQQHHQRHQVPRHQHHPQQPQSEETNSTSSTGPVDEMAMRPENNFNVHNQ